MNALLYVQKRQLVWFLLAILLIMALLALAVAFSGGSVSLAGLNAFDPAFIPHEFSPWGIDANRFIY